MLLVQCGQPASPVLARPGCRRLPWKCGPFLAFADFLLRGSGSPSGLAVRVHALSSPGQSQSQSQSRTTFLLALCIVDREFSSHAVPDSTTSSPKLQLQQQQQNNSNNQSHSICPKSAPSVAHPPYQMVRLLQQASSSFLFRDVDGEEDWPPDHIKAPLAPLSLAALPLLLRTRLRTFDHPALLHLVRRRL